MNVLVACEESQRVCIAFRERGHRVFSCDLQDCSGGRTDRENYKDKQFVNGSKARSKTFPCIAAAMADQWGDPEALTH